MKKLLYLAGIVLSLTACSKDDENIHAETKSCRLKTLSIQGATMNFTYNTDGYVSKKEVIVDNQGKITNNMFEYVYNADNQLITFIYKLDGAFQAQTDLTYKDKLLAKVIKTNTSNQVFGDTLIYDGNKRLTETRKFDSPNSFNSFYKYDNNGNLIEVESFTYNKLSYRSTYGNYDNKLNPYSTLKGDHMPNLDMEIEHLGQLMKNNPGFIKHVFISHESDGTIREIIDAFDTYTYSYNENNYPSTITQKYKDGKEDIINATYDCQ